MRRRRRGQRNQILALLVACLLLAIVLLLRVRDRTAASEPAEQSVIETTEETYAVEETETGKNEAAPTPSAVLTEAIAETEETPVPAEKAYNAETYQIVSDMVYLCRSETPDREGQIQALLESLEEVNPALGRTWDGIMQYWSYVNSEMPIRTAGLPDTLPQDESLCLVVLGFQLFPDGDMAPELLGRCELALACSRQYPHAYLAVTGGGTAFKNKEVTEAGVMADWFVERGVAPERIIREDRSQTTDQNAVNTCAILAEKYPQIHTIVVITSDYHVPLGCLLFTEAALLYGFENGLVPYIVEDNAAFATDGLTPGYTGMRNQAPYVWTMADPHY